MPKSYFSGDTLDDALHQVIQEILSAGSHIHPSRGPCKEITGVLLEISNPRARFSRTETKGKPFSSLGELCWYLAKSNDKDFISYYLRHYDESADANIIHGAYGPRLFDWKELNQVNQVVTLLNRQQDSRKAVIQLFDAMDLAAKHSDVPCTCALQFMVRDRKLHLVVYMRSNDAFIGLPHDAFCFTMLQEILARTLSVELGYYKHAVGSLHLYDKDAKAAREYLKEGWQSTAWAMPPMPKGDPWPSINVLLKAESALRINGDMPDSLSKQLDAYWADLVRLLQIFRFAVKDKNAKAVAQLREQMSSQVYDWFIAKKLPGSP